MRTDVHIYLATGMVSGLKAKAALFCHVKSTTIRAFPQEPFAVRGERERGCIRRRRCVRRGGGKDDDLGKCSVEVVMMEESSVEVEEEVEVEEVKVEVEEVEVVEVEVLANHDKLLLIERADVITTFWLLDFAGAWPPQTRFFDDWLAIGVMSPKTGCCALRSWDNALLSAVDSD